MENMTLAQALSVLEATSEGLRSVANECSSTYRATMHRRAVEFDDARKVIEAHVAQSKNA